ncbi:MAG: AAA family ATPase, partial [Mycobacteriales bacterium]
MATLDLTFFGVPRMHRDGQPVEVDTRKATALAAYLAVTGTPHSRDALAALLWPDYPQVRARAALRRTLSVLNKATGGACLLLSRATVGLDPDAVHVDVWEFERLVDATAAHPHPPADTCPDCVSPLHAAATVYEGHFLQGFALRDSPEFDDWQAYQDERYRQRLAHVLERLVSARVAMGDLAAATADGRRWLSLDALHEPAHQRLIQLYAWSGDRGAATRQYRECVRILDEELGVPPLPETTALYEAVLEGTELAGSRRAPLATTAPPRMSSAPYPLVGRDAELASLLSDARGEADGGRLVVVAGEPGVGKTRLAEELVERLQADGAHAIRVRCHEGESGLAFGALGQLVRGALAVAPDAVAALAAPTLAELSRVVPEVAAGRSDLPESPALARAAAQARLYAAVVDLVTAALAGAQPGVVLLDDAHWMDDASLGAVTYLVRRLRAVPVVVVATWRSEQVGDRHPLSLMSAAARRERLGSVHVLARLTNDDVAALIAASDVPR